MSSALFNKRFWEEVFERAVKSAAQAVVGTWAIGAEIFNAFDMNLNLTLGVALGGFVLSVLTSLATMRMGEEGTPSALGKRG